MIQDDSFNKSNIQTVIVASITTNLNLADAPGNTYLEHEESGLPKNGVINVSQISTVDKKRLLSKVGNLPPRTIHEIDVGLKMVLNIQ